jgi:WD40 repeat protein
MVLLQTSLTLLIAVLNTVSPHNSWTHTLNLDASTTIASQSELIKQRNHSSILLARILSGHSVVAMARDGQTVAGVTHNNKITLWNLKTGTEIRTLIGHSLPILSLAVSPDGQLLASAGHEKTIKIFVPHSGQKLLLAIFFAPQLLQ